MDPLAPTTQDLASFNDLISRLSPDGLSALDAAIADHNSSSDTQFTDRATYWFYVFISAENSWISHYLTPGGGF